MVSITTRKREIFNFLFKTGKKGDWKSKFYLLSQLIEHASTNSRRVRSQNVLLRLLYLPVVLVADRSVAAAVHMRLPHALQIVGRQALLLGLNRIGQEEGVVRVTRRMLLGLKQGVKVPESILHIVVGRHLREAHLDEDLADLGANLHQRMQMAGVGHRAERVQVVLFELFGFPQIAIDKE